MTKVEELLIILQTKNLLAPDKAKEFENILAQDKTANLEDWLEKNKLLDLEKVAEAEAEIYKLPYKNLQTQAVKEDALHFLPEEISKNYSIVCFAKDHEIADVGMVNLDLKAMESVNFLAQSEGLKVEYYLISKRSFDEAFKQYEKMEEEVSTALRVKAHAEGQDIIQVKQETSEILSEEDVNSAPIAKIVSVIIRHAVESRASDIHIEPYENESRVRYRIDGILHNSLVLPKTVHNSVVARIKVLAKLKLDETRVPQDGHIRLIIDNREIDFRVSTLPLANAEKVEMRILDQSKGIITLEDLGFNHFCLTAIRDGLKRTSGIILLTGPTGSGKTTTLYAVINILNKEPVNISTLEDPIEYQIKGVNQAQVKPELGFNFVNGLRSLLRQDPNIIMVGEIRDAETAELGVQAGLTGHLVLSTLHTNDALGAIFRLVDMEIEPFLLASTLRMVIAQRLVRRLCNYCKKEVPMQPKMIEQIIFNLKNLPLEVIQKELPDVKSLEDIRTAKFYEPAGCARCSSTGYNDRIAIAEAITIDDSIKEYIINKRQELDLDVVKEHQLFISIKQDGIFKILQGITNLDEVLRVVEIENL
jgi:type IV pilus assembly protein PilB